MGKCDNHSVSSVFDRRMAVSGNVSESPVDDLSSGTHQQEGKAGISVDQLLDEVRVAGRIVHRLDDTYVFLWKNFIFGRHIVDDSLFFGAIVQGIGS